MSNGSPDWKREFQAATARANKLQASLDQMIDLLAKQGDQLKAIAKMLRRREDQLKQAERENRRLRRKLGLDDPDPDPDAVEVPNDVESVDEDADASISEPTDDPTMRCDEGAESATSGTDDATPAAARDDDDAECQEQPSSEAKPRRGGGGRRPPPPHLPTDTEHYEACACGACGGRTFKRDVQRTSIYSVVSTYLRRRVIEREVVVCADPDCGTRTTAAAPPMPYERALYDCAFIAWLVTMKFGYLMPLDRIRLMLASKGVHIAMGTLVRLVEKATELADAVDGEHFRQLKAGRYVCFDGTGLKLLVPGQNKAWDGYLEVFARDHLTVFQFDLTKHADQLAERLRHIHAVLVTDAESRNKAGAPGATFSHCNAHVVRKFEDAERVQPILAKEGRGFLRELYDIEDAAEALGLDEVALKAYRQRRCRPVLKRFRRWLQSITAGPLPPSDPVAKTARYYLKHWRDLTRYAGTGDLPMDNNAAEREFQRHAKLRYASLFAGSEEGAHRWATLLGVVRTAQKLGLDLQAYLTWMFERRGTHRRQFGLSARELTPEAYLAAGCPGSLTATIALAA